MWRSQSDPQSVCAAPGQWKVIGAVFGAVSAVKHLSFFKHTREQYIWAHAVDRERETKGERQRERHIYGGVGQALRLEIGEI